MNELDLAKLLKTLWIAETHLWMTVDLDFGINFCPPATATLALGLEGWSPDEDEAEFVVVSAGTGDDEADDEVDGMELLMTSHSSEMASAAICCWVVGDWNDDGAGGASSSMLRLR